ncbi:MAG TPA: citryl-CoA lyase [Acidimicrobiales bacterium]|nr:citryl-CoA lyase [Acidimicrobiales bacterium]
MERTIPRFVRSAVDAVPDKTWLLTEGGEHTYAGAQAQIERAAAALRSAGIGVGDRVLVTARNSDRYLFTWLALMEVGAVEVPLNPRSTEAELRGFVEQVRPVAIVSDPELGPLVDAAVDGAGGVAARLDVHELFEASPDGRGPAAIDPSDVAVMIPTSGTTGRSKLVMQTHLAYVMAGEGFPFWLQLDDTDRLMTSLPLFHINAPAYSTLGSIAARASLVLLPGFSASGFLDSARRFGATEFNSIGAMLEILMRQPRRDDDADNPLRRCYTGPTPARERQLEIEARFGIELVCGYGLSESPYALMWRPGERPFGTLGSVRQHPQLGVVNEARVMGETGTDVEPGGVGELELRNPAVMKGYFEMPAETAAVFHDGWLRTGDLVRDNGNGTYTFVGRVKEVIRRRGENLSPAEVEAALEGHPTVAEAAVIAVPSELSEDDVKAFLLPAPGAMVDVAAVREFAAARLAAFKVPRYFEVVDELPHGPTGRLTKHRLSVERTVAEVDFGSESGQARGVDGSVERPDDATWLRTWIGSSGVEHTRVAGRDLPTEVMGHLSLTELSYLLVTRREPTAAQRRQVDAVLVSLADHGLTPSALATRLTYTGAPESLQGAVAAGLLGAGSVFLGPTGDTAELLADALERSGRRGDLDDSTLRATATEIVETSRAAGARVPGLGHPIHKGGDPRTPRIYELAEREGLLGPHLRLLAMVAEAHAAASGRSLPINGAGAGGAALLDAGVPAGAVRGMALIARTAGLVAHLVEEAESPIGLPLWREVETRAVDDVD